MTDVPVSPTEISTWYPPSLGNLEPRPSFRFRPPSPRTKRRYSHALTSEGLRYHSTEAIQSEALRAMRGLWTGDEALLLANESRLNTFWETVRQAQKDKTITIDRAEAEAIGEALLRLTDNWPKLRQMNADNQLFNTDAPKIALGMYLAGWSGLETAFKLEDGTVPLATLDLLETEVAAIEKKAMADKVEGVIGIAFTQLELHALGLMDMGLDTEKNSQSPSLPSGTPDGSAAAGSAPKPRATKSATSPSPRARRRKSAPKRASS